jgi:two-component system sensor histidine kinase UhpB
LAVAIQNERLVAAATLYSNDLKQLSSRLLTAQERERKWISFELHDEIGQVVTAITLKLAEIERAVTEPGSAVPSDLLAETRELVARVMEQIRSLSRDLRPSMLQDLGLIPTLNWYVNRYRTQTGIQVDFEADLLLARSDENVESALYRIVQEALTNVARHAQAKNVHLELYQRDGTMTVDIDDDGIGFGDNVLESSPTNEHGIGLVAIRERAAALGGRAVIRSAPGKGTHIHVEVPLERESNGRDHSLAG